MIEQNPGHSKIRYATFQASHAKTPRSPSAITDTISGVACRVRLACLGSRYQISQRFNKPPLLQSGTEIMQ